MAKPQLKEEHMKLQAQCIGHSHVNVKDALQWTLDFQGDNVGFGGYTGHLDHEEWAGLGAWRYLLLSYQSSVDKNYEMAGFRLRELIVSDH